MVESGIPVDIVNDYRNTALVEAAKNNRTAVVHYLLMKGANVDKQVRDGWTALHHASVINSTAIIKILLQQGATTNIKNDEGSLPIDLARRRNHEEVVQLLQ